MVVKYPENALDERIRMEIERNTEDVTKDITEKYVLACLNEGISEEKIHNMFGVPLNRIMELKSTL